MTSDYSSGAAAIAGAIDAVYAKKTHDHNSHISYGQVDSTSTSTAFTATVSGLTSLTDGSTVILENGVASSASGFTLNVNGLGAKPVYSSMHAATAETTVFDINYTLMFVYDSTRVSGGCWICYRGWYKDTNDSPLGYTIRTNKSSYTPTDKTYRYRLILENNAGKYVPVNTSTSSDATVNKSSYMNTKEFLLGGNIFYYGYTSAVAVNGYFGTGYCWRQQDFNLGYSFNNTSDALTLTAKLPVYMVAQESANNKGMATLASPYYTQTLPSSADGKLYIFLGMASSATNVELALQHPIFEYRDGGVKLWSSNNHTHTKSQITDFPSTMTPSAHTHNYSDVNGVSTFAVTVTYTNNTSETINLLKYTSS